MTKPPVLGKGCEFPSWELRAIVRDEDVGNAKCREDCLQPTDDWGTGGGSQLLDFDLARVKTVGHRLELGSMQL